MAFEEFFLPYACKRYPALKLFLTGQKDEDEKG
jgi:hypothetical protein